MHILLINHYAGSKRHGMEFRPYYMAHEWQKLGHTVQIVAATFSHLRSQNPATTAPLTRETIDGVEYFWIRTPAYRGNGLGRVKNMLAFTWGLLRHRRALCERRPDVVIASSTYPLEIYAAKRLADRTGARLVFEVHDIWPLSPMLLAGMSRWHPFIAVMQHAEDYAYRHAWKVVSILPTAEAHMRGRGLAPGKFFHVPNGIVLADWAQPAPLPAAAAARLDALRQEGRFLVAYAGSHGIANGLDTVIDAAALLRDEPVTFVLVGKGPEKAPLQQRAAGLGLTNVVFLDPVPKLSIPTLLERMDVLYVSFKRSPLFQHGISPNKLMDYMMAGRPVIQAIDAGNDMVGEAQCGITIAPEDPAALVEAVRRFRAMPPAERARLGANGHAHAIAHHDYNVLASRFAAALQN